MLKFQRDVGRHIGETSRSASARSASTNARTKSACIMHIVNKNARLALPSTIVDFKFDRHVGAAPASICQVTKLYNSGNFLPNPLCLGSATLLMGPRLPHPF